MTPDRWKDITGNIKDNFEVEDEGHEHIDEEGGIDIEFIVFSGPLGLMRLEFISKPVVLDKKTTYSKRIGSETKVDYVYSRDEMGYALVAYKWDNAQDGWVEIDAGSFG
jgi:hypothetical protein